MTDGSDSATPQQPARLPAEPFADLNTQQTAALLADPPAELVLLDVRSAPENELQRLPGEQLLLDVRDPGFYDALAALPREPRYIVYCRTGNRSGFAVGLMARLGFTAAHNVLGGIKAWAEAGLPVVEPDTSA